MTGRLMPVAHRRLAGGGWAAEAVEAGEAQRQVLLVDPDVAAVLGVGVVALVEVESLVADVAEGGCGLFDRLAADGAGVIASGHFPVRLLGRSPAPRRGVAG